MKKFAFVLTAAFLFLFNFMVFDAHAFYLMGDCGSGVKYELETDSGLLEIYGSGKMDDYTGVTYTPWGNYARNIKKVVIKEGVKNIGNSAFDNCTALSEIVIPSTVESIGRGAFYNCYSLTKFSIPSNVRYIGEFAFNNCINLEEITIPDGMEEIGSNSFEYCQSLKSITIPDSVTVMGTSVFGQCTSLESAVIGDGIKEITQYLFNGCSRLNTITLGSGIEKIGYEPFMGCYALENVYIKSLQQWCKTDFPYSSSNPMYYAKNLYVNGETFEELVISEGIEKIGKFAFYNMDNIKSVTIPSTLKIIDENAFENCDSIENLYITDLKSWCGMDIRNYGAKINYSGSMYVNGEPLVKLVVPDGVEKIGSFTFYNNDDITEVTIPSDVKAIGREAFSGCYSIERVNASSVEAWAGIDFESRASNPLDYAEKLYVNGEPVVNAVFKSGIETIGKYAFCGAADLTSVTIPSSVKKICEGAFDGCYNVREVHIESVEDWCKIVFEEMNSNPLGSGASLYQNGDLVEKVVLKDGTKTVGNYVFYSCESIRELEIPDSVETIGEYAFNGCYNLATVKMGTGVNSLGRYAFEYTNFWDNRSNWRNNVLYLGHILLKAKENIYGDYTINEGTKIISASAFDNCYQLTGIVLPESLEIIGDSAFANCSKLKNVNFTKNITYIGENAFEYCNQLTTVVIPDKVRTIGQSAFYNCNGVTSLTLGSSVESIGQYAFYSCSISSLDIPASVRKIGSSAFSSCSYLSSASYAGYAEDLEMEGNYELERLLNFNKGRCGDDCYWYYDADTSTLTIRGTGEMYDKKDSYDAPWYTKNLVINKVVIEEGVESIGGYAFYNCYNLTDIDIPSTVRKIGVGAFLSCGILAEVNLPDAVEEIGDMAFMYCYKLRNITIPEKVSKIPSHIFYDCFELETVEYSDNVTEIGKNAFNRCWKLKNAFAGKGIEKIGDGAFYECKALTEIIIHDTVVEIGRIAFGDCENVTTLVIGSGVEFIDEYAFSSCGKITVASLPASVKNIGDGIFFQCYGLADVDLPRGMKKISNKMFMNCTSLGAVEIPDTVEEIGDHAFHECSKIAKVMIPDGVTAIGNYAFYNCSSLSEVIIGDTVLSVGDNAFENCKRLYRAVYEGEKGTLNIGTGNSSFERVIKYMTGKAGTDCIWSIDYGTGVLRISGEGAMPDYQFAMVTPWYNESSYIKEIAIAEGVTSIGNNAFASCSGAERISIPAGVQKLGQYSLADTTEIYYAGSDTDWNSISNESGYGGNINCDVEMNRDGGFIIPSVEETEEVKLVTVDLHNVAESNTIMAIGMQNGALCTYMGEYSDNGDIVFAVDKGADNVKIFVWESFETMRPVLKSKEVR